MNSPRFGKGILMALLITAASVCAGPSVSFPEKDVSWSVDIQPFPNEGAVTPPVSSPNSAVLKKVEVTPSATLVRSILFWSTGQTTEAWWLKTRNWLIFDHPEGGVIITTNPEMHATWRPGAELFDWVNERSFVKETVLAGQPCSYHRRTLLRPDEGAGGKEPSITDEAWIEAGTMRPVAVRQGRTLYTFRFREAPSPALVLPPRFAEELARAETASVAPARKGKSRSWTRD